jgi:hypothetical protein
VPQLIAGALASRERFVLSGRAAAAAPPADLAAATQSSRPTRPEERLVTVSGSQTGATAWDDIGSRWSGPADDTAEAFLPRQRSSDG